MKIPLFQKNLHLKQFVLLKQNQIFLKKNIKKRKEKNVFVDEQEQETQKEVKEEQGKNIEVIEEEEEQKEKE